MNTYSASRLLVLADDAAAVGEALVDELEHRDLAVLRLDLDGEGLRRAAEGGRAAEEGGGGGQRGRQGTCVIFFSSSGVIFAVIFCSDSLSEPCSYRQRMYSLGVFSRCFSMWWKACCATYATRQLGCRHTCGARLGHVNDVSRTRPAPKAAPRLARPGVRLELASEELDHRRLAGAVGTYWRAMPPEQSRLPLGSPRRRLPMQAARVDSETRTVTPVSCARSAAG